MMFIEQKEKLYGLQAKEMHCLNLRPVSSKILSFLAKRPSYPKEIAKSMGIEEQKIYYHIHNLERKGMIKVIKKIEHGGAIAKIYALTKPCFYVKFKEPEVITKIIRVVPGFLEPFISDGHLNAKIIIGSPDPHGPENARARDVGEAADFALFIGTFLDGISKSHIIFDTEAREDDLKENMILIGGPITNRITKAVNDKLQAKFDSKKNIFSTATGKTYKNDECGIIVKTVNPFNREKKMLVIAGKRQKGTKAAVLAFLQGQLKEKDNFAKVVEGIDEDSDGIIDHVNMIE